MTVPRFLAFAGEPHRLRSFLTKLMPAEQSSQRLNRELDQPGVAVFTSPETPVVRLEDDEGLIIGRLYGRESCEPLKRLGEGASKAVAATGGKSLLADFWGNNVCFACAGSAVTVLRDPSAAVPAYLAEVEDILVWFSDLAICNDLGVADRQVDEEYLRQC